MPETFEPDDDPSPSNVEDALAQLKPRMREVVERFDPSMLDAFDAVYDDGAADAVDAILRADPGRDELAGEQALGLEGFRNNVVAFLINVAAALAVERFHHELPYIWDTMVGSAPPAVTEPQDRVVIISERACHSKADKERLERAIRQDPKLMRMLGSARPR